MRSGFEFFVHGRIAVFVARPRHVLSFLAVREVWMCKKRAMVTSLLTAMLLEVGAGVLETCAHFISLVDEFQCGVFLCQFGTDTQAHRLRFGAWSVRSGHL